MVKVRYSTPIRILMITSQIYDVQDTGQFRSDLKLAKKQGLDLALLGEIVRLLRRRVPLPPKHCDHPLQGRFKGTRECHITPDWLLIYSVEERIKIIRLIRTGSHSSLFGK